MQLDRWLRDLEPGDLDPLPPHRPPGQDEAKVGAGPAHVGGQRRAEPVGLGQQCPGMHPGGWAGLIGGQCARLGDPGHRAVRRHDEQRPGQPGGAQVVFCLVQRGGQPPVQVAVHHRGGHPVRVVGDDADVRGEKGGDRAQVVTGVAGIDDPSYRCLVGRIDGAVAQADDEQPGASLEQVTYCGDDLIRGRAEQHLTGRREVLGDSGDHVWLDELRDPGTVGGPSQAVKRLLVSGCHQQAQLGTRQGEGRVGRDRGREPDHRGPAQQVVPGQTDRLRRRLDRIGEAHGEVVRRCRHLHRPVAAGIVGDEGVGECAAGIDADAERGLRSVHRTPSSRVVQA